MNRVTTVSSVIKLMLKDIKAVKIFFIIIIPLYLLYALQFFSFNLAYIFTNIIYTFFLAMGITIIDYKYNTDQLFLSLPLKRATIVIAKYTTSYIGILLGTTFCFIYGYLLDFIIIPGEVNFDSYLILQGILPYLFILLFFISLFYPYYFRFGIGKGLIAFIISILCFTSVIILLLWGVSSITNSMGFVVELKELRNPGLLVLNAFIVVHNYIGSFLFISFMILAMAGISFLSIHLSIKFYKQREF